MIHNTGDKFVIEIGEVIERHSEPPLYKIAGFNALVFDEFGLNRLGKLTNGVDDGYMANLKQKDSFDDRKYWIATQTRFKLEYFPLLGTHVFLTQKEAERQIERLENK